MALTVSVAAGANTPALGSANSTEYTLEVEDETTTFELVATASEAVTSIEWVTEKGDPITPVGSPVTTTTTSTASFSIAQTGGVYVARAKKSASSSATSAPVKVSKKAAPPDKAVSGKNVYEVEVGEFSWVFTIITGLISLALAGAVAWVVAEIIFDIKLPNLGTHTKDQIPNGTWTERTGSIVILIAAGVGTIVLALGTWFAGLEVRGRLRRPSKGEKPKTGIAVTKGALDVVTKLPEVLAEAAKLRGTVAVIVAGALILIGALWAATALDPENTTPAPQETPTVNVSVTTAPEPAPTP